MARDLVTQAEAPQGAALLKRRALRLSWRLTVGGLLGFILVLMLLVHAFFLQTFTVPSASMEPTYKPGQHILVDRWRPRLGRGTVIVFSGEGSLYQPSTDSGFRSFIDGAVGLVGFHPDERDYLKRIIGVGGDNVSVDKSGTLRINGRITPEPYLPGGVKASLTPFTAKVPPGEFFVMGDDRVDSDDSRNHLGDPGGGMVPRDKVIGTVKLTY